MVVSDMAQIDYETLEERGDVPYPPYVQTDEDKKRWNAAVRAAMVAMDEPQESYTVIAATRSLYGSDIPT